MHAFTRLLSIAWLGLAASFAPAVLAQANDPTQPIRFIVPYTAGGSADFMALLKTDVDKFGRVVTFANIKGE